MKHAFKSLSQPPQRGQWGHSRLWEYSRQGGQTLIEVIIAVAVVGGILTAITVGITYSIKSTAQSRFRSVATNKAQQVIETFRRERQQLGWSGFTSLLSNGATYCVNTLPSTSQEFAAMNTGVCNGVADFGTTFTRTAVVTIPSASEVEVLVTVKWNEGAVLQTMAITQKFKQEDS